MRSIKIIFLSIILALCWIYSALAATYYMRADGTAANKAAATGPPSDKSKCISVATHNSQTFSDGDVIKISDKGGLIADQIIPPVSGTNVGITYTAVDGESPILDYARVLTSWSLYSGQVYQATKYSINPVYMLFKDGVPVGVKASSSSCSDGDWYASGIRVYFKCPTGEKPENYRMTYAMNEVRIGFDFSNKSHIIVDGLTFRGSNIMVGSTSSSSIVSHITVRNCTFMYGGVCAAAVYFHGDNNGVEYVKIHNNYFYRIHGAFKIYNASYGNYITVTDNEFEGVGCFDGSSDSSKSHSYYYKNSYDDRDCIGFQNVSNVVISGNKAYNGAFMFLVYWVRDNFNAQNISIYNNFVYNTDFKAIYLSGGQRLHNHGFTNLKIYNNIFSNCGRGGTGYGAAVIHMRNGSGSTGMNYIENNTCRPKSGGQGIYSSPISAPHNLTIKNNIVYNVGGTYTIAFWNGDTNLVIDYNCVNIDGKYGRNGKAYSLSAFRRNGYETYGKVSDSLFSNPEGTNIKDYRLQSSSPCKGAGADVSLMKDFQGNKWRNLPSMGVIEFK